MSRPAVTALEFDFTTRSIRPLDLDEAAEAAALGRCVWVDIPLGEDGDDRAGLEGLGLGDHRFFERALGAASLEAADHDADRLHLRLTDCRLKEGGIVHQRIDLLLEERLMLSVHRGHSSLSDDLRRHIPSDFARRAQSPAFLVYEVGARIIDAYRSVQAELEERLASLQARVASLDPGAVEAIPELDGELLAFRRAVIGTRDALSELGGRQSAFVSAASQPYLSAQALALDRLQRDTLGSREILSSTLSLSIAATSGRAARALGRLSAITVIFLPLVFAIQVIRADLDWASPGSAFWALAVLGAAAVLLYMRRHRLL